MAKDENIHAGHRERLLETVHNVGLSNLSPVQAMEFILFYIFPRGDTNPLAHRLLDKFENISTILDASLEDIKAVKGMGETSAKKLKALVEIFNLYTTSKIKKDSVITTFGDIYDYAESLLRFKNVEEMYVFGFNAQGKFLGDRCLARGNTVTVGIDMLAIANFISTYRVAAVFIAHNHPDGTCSPSRQDIISCQELQRKFEFAGCKLMDNFIVGSDGIYSIKSREMKRVFTQNNKYNEFFDTINTFGDDMTITNRRKI